MKQVFRRVLDGKGVIQVKDLPMPACAAGHVLVKTAYTAISAGTEGATLSKTFPELVKQTLKDPWMRESVKNLVFGANPKVVKDIVWDETTLMRAIGYSGSGVVLEVGSGVSGFKPGDRVAFAAEGHAEFVAPSRNFVVPVPDGLSLEEAAFVTMGGIALQGARRAEIQLGEKVVVYGLGLVGLLVAQLVAAAGGQVIGVDLDKRQLELLNQMVPGSIGICVNEFDVVQAVLGATGGHGADAVLICASSKKEDIANNAMKMCRKQAKVVFIGLVKMNLERMPFFRNELDLRFSRAYGPGCMEQDYERGRVDYPYHYVRWTEQRNLQEFLRLVNLGKVDLKPLVGGVYGVENAQQAYDELYSSDFKGNAALLRYEGELKKGGRVVHPRKTLPQTGRMIRVGIIGCGNFSRSTHIPNFDRNGSFAISGIASATGVNAVSICDRFNIPLNTTDYHEILNNDNVDAVVISTRHDTHCEIACDALARGKHVLVEKPAVLSREQYDRLYAAVNSSNAVFMVGYNRRYSPLAQKLKQALNPDLPIIVNYQVCVPEIPKDHWTLNAVEGGGRLIGEAEHFFDFINFLVGDAPDQVHANCLVKDSETVDTQFNFSVGLNYRNKALATVTYTSFASPKMSREQVVIFQGGRTLFVDDFKKLHITGAKISKKSLVFSAMGHKEEIVEFADLIQNGQRTGADVLLAASNVALTAREKLLAQNSSDSL